MLKGLSENRKASGRGGEAFAGAGLVEAFLPLLDFRFAAADLVVFLGVLRVTAVFFAVALPAVRLLLVCFPLAVVLFAVPTLLRADVLRPFAALAAFFFGADFFATVFFATAFCRVACFFAVAFLTAVFLAVADLVLPDCAADRGATLAPAFFFAAALALGPVGFDLFVI